MTKSPTQYKALPPEPDGILCIAVLRVGGPGHGSIGLAGRAGTHTWPRTWSIHVQVTDAVQDLQPELHYGGTVIINETAHRIKFEIIGE